MNLTGLINKTMNIGKYLITAVMLISLASVAASVDASSGLSTALTQLCQLSQTFLGIASMLLIVLAGCIYVIGQILGAETRARATVWATAMLTGAIIGILIYILAPFIIQTLISPASGKVGNVCSGVSGLSG